MTSLRKTSSNGLNPEDDVEAPKIDDPTKTFTARPSSSSLCFSGSNKKIITEMTVSTIAGFFIACIIIPILVYLDHREVIHYQKAHIVRGAGMQALGDTNTRTYVEEMLNVKLMMMDEYKSASEELKEAVETIAENHEKMKNATAKLMANGEEMPGLAAQFLTLANDPKLELDKFCGACPWDSIATCDQRVEYLQDKKNMRPIPATVITMVESPTCKQTEEYNALMNNPLLGLDKYCGACQWDDKMTCDGRVDFMQKSRNIGLLQARISAMEVATCKIHKN